MFKQILIKRCKYDLYPLGKQCSYDEECFSTTEDNEYACVDSENAENYMIKSVGGNNNITIEDVDERLLIYSFVENIEGKKIKIKNSSSGISSFYKITNFDITNYNFIPIYYPNHLNEIDISIGNNYDLIFYEKENNFGNICISKINEGGKISSIENNFLKNLMLATEEPCKKKFR